MTSPPWFPWPLEWTLPLVAAVAAPLAVLVTYWLSVRGLDRRDLTTGTRRAARFAAVSRAAAIGLALLAAAGPVRVERESPPGIRAVAAPFELAVPGTDVAKSDISARWPNEAPHALDALNLLRATRAPRTQTALVLATDGRFAGTDGAVPDPRDLRRALSAFPGLEPGLLRIGDRTPEHPAPAAQARLLAPASAVSGLPFRLVLVAGREPLPAGPLEIDIEGRVTTFTLTDATERTLLPPVTLPEGEHRCIVRWPDDPTRLPAARFVQVAPPPRALVLSRSTQQSIVLSNWLTAQGIEVLAAGNLASLSKAIDEASVFVVGPGVGNDALGTALARRVRAGGGLVVLGGAEREGLSRLQGSDLAGLLPIDVPEPPPEPDASTDPTPETPPDPEPKDPGPSRPEVRLDDGEKDALRVALLLCIDRSGSMAGPKMRLAQEAAIAAARTLDGEDRVGVIAFNDRAAWVAPFQSAAHQGTLRQQVRAMEAEGGTNFYPALKDGIEAILEQRCGIRHIVLLTDGVTRTAVFSKLVSGGAQRGVTLSTVAVGDGADTRLLGLLANWGRGKLYLAIDPKRLPAIVTLDSRTFGRDVRENLKNDAARPDIDIPLPSAPDQTKPRDRPEPDGTPATPTEQRRIPTPRVPVQVVPAASLAGFEGVRWPPLAHPEGVTARPGTHVPLVWSELPADDRPTSVTAGGPALVLGRGGLGLTAVVCADLTGRDATAFGSWERAGTFLAQLVRSVDPPPITNVGALEGHFIATRADATGPAAFLQIPGAPAGMLSIARVTRPGDPDAIAIETRVQARSGGALTQLEGLPLHGVYAGFLTDDAGGLRRILAVSPGPARSASGTDRAVLDAQEMEQLAQSTGLRLRKTLPPVGVSPLRERREPAEPVFLIGALFFLLLESAWRRVART